jgi:CBS domain containing-hemolysin-like protein
MFTLVEIAGIAVLFMSGYIVSLFTLAVFIAPDEIETLFPGVSASRRKLLRRLAEDPRLLTQMAFICKAAVLVLATLLTVRFLDAVSQAGGVSPWLVFPVGLMAVWLAYLFFVEFLPRLSSRRAVKAQMARHLWLISVLYYVLRPVVLLYRKALLDSRADNKVTEEEKEDLVERAIETLADEAGIGETIVEDDEKEMIGQIFLLDQTVVREIMIPRIDIVGIEKNTSFRDIREIIRRDGHSRYPVYDGTIDKIVGLVYVKDLFHRMPEPGEEFAISKYVRQPYFVPETKIIGELLHEFKTRRFHIAVAVDEYGGVAGLVTLEDIIEEIFGEIEDEHDSQKTDLTRLPDGRYLVSASLLVDRMQDYLDIDYPQTEYDTVGGLIYDLVGSVPSEGQKVRWHDLEFEVAKIEGQRILTVRVKKMTAVG